MLGDLKFTFRSLRRQPGFALAAILTLAVGIGATTAIFSTVNAALLRPLPYPHPEDLFAVYTPATDGRFTTGRCSGVELMRLNDPNVSVVRAAGAGRIDTTIIRDDGTAIPTVGYGVTEGFFDVFGVPPTAGRFFTHAEHAPNTAPVAVLSYRIWRDLFGADPGMIGKTVRLGTSFQPFTVVGIGPRDLDIPRGADFWVNFSITPQSTGHGFDGYMRIKPGISLARLNSEMASAMTGIARDYGMLGTNRRYDVRPLVNAMVGDLRSTLLVVLGAAGLLLLLASVNVTNLLLARGAVRAREIAVRVALGAGRGRIVRQLLTESLVLSAAGTLLGLLFAFVGLRVLLAYGASELPRLDHVPFDARVLLFALGALFVTGIIVGFAPALRLAGSSLKALMNESGRSATGGGTAHRMLKGMIVAEIALAITIVAGAGWLVKSFANLGSADPGFVAPGRVVFDVLMRPTTFFPPPPPPGTPAPPPNPTPLGDRVAQWTGDLKAKIHAIGGVTSVGSAATFPFGQDRDGVLYLGIQGDIIDPDHPLVARAHAVSADFFDAMGVKLISGRQFTVDDRPSTTRVAIVNRTFARRYLSGKDPLRTTFTAGYPTVPASPVMTIVGVVEDVRYLSVGQAADPAYYMPEAQQPFLLQTFVVNTSLPHPTSIASPLKAAVSSMDPLIPIQPRSLTDIVQNSLTRQRLGMTLMLLFAIAALALAAVGIYGVIAYASAQRVGEVATRMALGATPSNVFWLMISQGRVLAIIGTVVGLAVAYGAGRYVSSQLYEVHASDPLILVSATALVVAITFLAIVVPARRAAQVDPSRILRMD
jgi:putative ABC transport system permease protein